MEDIMQFSGYMNVRRDVVLIKLKISVLEEMFDVSQVAGDEVVHCDNVESFGDKSVAKMRAKKARSACDEHSLLSH
jgi:hypothetical protein